METQRLSSLLVSVLPVGQMQANCYLVWSGDTRQAIIIDPGDDDQYIEDTICRLSLRPLAVYATHGHFDHIMATWALELAYGIPFFVHPKDQFLIRDMPRSTKRFLGITADPPPPSPSRLPQTFSVGKASFQSIEVPGHTPGSVIFYNAAEQLVFGGDLLFADGAIGRTDFSYSNPLAMEKSLAKALSLPPETIVFPGHGAQFTVAKYLALSGPPKRVQ